MELKRIIKEEINDFDWTESQHEGIYKVIDSMETLLDELPYGGLLDDTFNLIGLSRVVRQTIDVVDSVRKESRQGKHNHYVGEICHLLLYHLNKLNDIISDGYVDGGVNNVIYDRILGVLDTHTEFLINKYVEKN